MYHYTPMIEKRCSAPGDKPGALLLLGPTGSGKSPLGEAAARSGLWGRRCLHFDFGENLRRAAAAGGGPTRVRLGKAQLAVVCRSLATGALLEDEDFPIAAEIFSGFLRASGFRPGDLVILNGLPRHAGQARDTDDLAAVIAVVELAAGARIVRERIRRDTGGDRKGRSDDSLSEIRKKLAVYEERTRPLVDHYRAEGAAVITIDVRVRTSAETMRQRLERSGRIALFTAP